MARLPKRTGVPACQGGVLLGEDQLDELELRTGANRDWAADLMVGETGRARPQWIAVHLIGARGR